MHTHTHTCKRNRKSNRRSSARRTENLSPHSLPQKNNRKFRSPAIVQVLVVVMLQIVETIFRSNRYGRVHDTCGTSDRRRARARRWRTGRAAVFGRLFWRGGSARSEQTDVPLGFFLSKRRHAHELLLFHGRRYYNIIKNYYYYISVIVAWRTKRKSRRVARGFVGGAFVRRRQRFARQRGADEEKKWRARVTDARTYANTMNYVMAGNSCALRRAPMPPPERRARIRTPRTRPPCFSRHFSRPAAFGRGYGMTYRSPRWAIWSVAAKTALKADKRPFRLGYCSHAGRPVSGGGDRPDGCTATGRGSRWAGDVRQGATLCADVKCESFRRPWKAHNTQIKEYNTCTPLRPPLQFFLKFRDVTSFDSKWGNFSNSCRARPKMLAFDDRFFEV